MKNHTIMWAWFATLMLTPTLLVGCDLECAEGTQEQNGTCVLKKGTITACAPGTVLSTDTNQCVLDISGCGAGVTLKDGVCVPAASACKDGATFSQALGGCVIDPHRDISCGPHTDKNDQGTCVSSKAVCEQGSIRDDMGRCVVANASCAQGTQLDAQSGKCELSDQACGGHTVLSSGVCVPSTDACGAGTVFNEDTHTCLPEAICQVGDVILNGTCVSPVEVLVHDPDFTEATGLDNPAFEGTPQPFTLKPKGEKVVLAGTIDAPVDENADSNPDQDLDFFEVELTQGQYMHITLQSVAGPGLNFRLAYIPADKDDTFDFIRFGPAVASYGTSRNILISKTGKYLLTIAPEAQLIDSTEVKSGDPSWQYAVTLEEKDWPTATNAGSDPLEGHVKNMNDNFYILDQHAAGGPFSFLIHQLGTSLPSASIQLWTSPTEFHSEVIIDTEESSVQLLPATPVYAVVDYIAAIGNDDGFHVTLEDPTNLEDLGTLPPNASISSTPLASFPSDAKHYYTITAPPHQLLEISFDAQSPYSFSSAMLEALEITAPDGTTVLPETALVNTSYETVPFTGKFYAYVATGPVGGTFLIRLKNNEPYSTHIDTTLTTTSITPKAPVTKAIGDTEQSTDATAIQQHKSLFLTYTFATDVRLQGTLSSAGANLDLRIINANTLAVDGDFGSFADEAFVTDLAAGTYIFEINAMTKAANGYVLNFKVLEAPTAEQEPNNDDGNATAWGAKAFALGSFIAGDLDVFSFNPAADLAADEFMVLRLNPAEEPSETIAYQCKVRNTQGVEIASKTGVRNECVMYLKDLRSTETYFFEVATLHTTDSTYELNSEVVTAHTSTANNSMATPDALGDLPAQGSHLELFGEVTTNGATQTTEYFTFQVSTPFTALDKLFITLEDIYNKRAAGLTVTLLDAQHTILGSLDDGDGTEKFSSLKAGIYTLQVTRNSNYLDQTGRYKLTMRRAQEFEFISDPVVEIPDSPGFGVDGPEVTDLLTVGTTCSIATVELGYTIFHSYPADLYFTLTSPAGTQVKLGTLAYSMSSGIFPHTVTPEESMDILVGEHADGDWILTMKDISLGSSGTLNSWTLRLTCM